MADVWPKHMPRSLDYPRVGVDALLAGASRAYPERVALREGDETLTFAELYDRALRVAAGLRVRGVRPGDTVALHLPNSAWFLVAYYGILCSGATAAALNPAQPPAALRQQLADCDVKAVFTHPRNGAVLADGAVPEGVRFAVLVPGSAAAPAPEGVGLPEGIFPDDVVPFADLLTAGRLEGYRVDPESVAHFQFTGGTTGRPKAVRVLHRNVVANAVQTACWRSPALPCLDEEDGLRLRFRPEAAHRHAIPPGEGVALSVAPLFHSLGLVGQNVNTLLGTTVTIAGRFAPDAFLESIADQGVTQLAGSPSMYHALLSSPVIDTADLTSVRMLATGAAPIDTAALARLRAAFPNAAVVDAYGLSECTAAVTYTPLDAELPVPAGAVGLPLFDTEVEIRSEDGATVLPQGATGEVWVRGPQVTDGYQGHPELTAEQFVDGRLRTGDLGHVDDQGFLFLVGRAKDMLIYKGYNVYPQPLEELLCSHPAVAQAAVVGRPDPIAGQVPVAFVVLRPSYVAEAARGGALQDEVLAHVARQVAPYQKVRDLCVVDALPLTPTGKILKTELRDRLGLAPC
ncbi:class I adenylate-forming enzyme family protein [Kitasatospora paranensis]|uniref:Class I adenylate-forming enzyme family protein n=1 Tax=Kitasatospora paranensis TaxID=258053 RepID=A0ABW2G764_9ACTN